MKNNNRTAIKKATAHCLAFALGASLTSAALATTSTGVEQLFLQEQLDKNQAFTQSQWVGTHNSYNAREWSSAYQADPNQDLKPYDQLASGARELTYDVGDYLTQLKLCHGFCAGGEKKFRDGLESIVRWLEDGNLHSVILLKLENNSNSYGQMADQLRAELGDYLYEASHSGGGNNCAGLPVDRLSKQDVLNAGKNIVVVNTDGKCPSSNDWKEVVHLGLQYTNSFEDKFDKPNDPDACLAATQSSHKRMQRIHDPSTLYGIGGGVGASGKKIDEANVASYLACGLNIFEMFWYNGDSAAGHLEPDDLLWSWKNTEPNNAGNGEDCAVSDSNGRWFDAACSNTYSFACRDQDEWKITTAAGVWSAGQTICASEYAGSIFAVPYNGYDNAQLINAKSYATESQVWLAYHDQSLEGFFTPTTQVRSVTKVAAVGGNNGSDFDDVDQAKLALLSEGSRYLSKVWIYAGTRVSQVGMEYSDGRSLKHGTQDNNNHETLTLSANEYVTSIKRCISAKGGEDRVYYLQLTTNKGNSINGGSNNKGSCTTTTHNDQRLIGFHGNFGDKAYSIGYYFMSH